MNSVRQLHLGAFMRPASIHTGAWRYPGAWPDMNFNFAHLKRSIQALERAKFDAFFMADHMAVLNMPIDALKRSHTVTSFEPFTLLSALSQATEHIGLVATGSTTFDAPYHIARRFASLDHISGGRAGWNIVTTSNPDAALNFGLDEHMEHGERYRRAREFYNVVTGLWDSWADDAFIRDTESGVYFDPAKMHVLGHRGEYLSVRGPLNIARPVQGWPVIVQAGASEPGRQLAAETAEAVFTAQSSIEAGRAFYADVKGRAEKAGRSRDDLKILPGCFVVIGETVEQAREKRAKLDSLVHFANAIGSLSIALGHDASKFDPDGPLPEIPESNASKSGRQRDNNETRIAMERGEVQASVAPATLFNGQLKPSLEQGKVRIVVQYADFRHPGLPDVPTIVEVAETQEATAVFKFLVSLSTLGRAYGAPTSVPAETLAILRNAFQAIMADPAFRKDAEKRDADVLPGPPPSAPSTDAPGAPEVQSFLALQTAETTFPIAQLDCTWTYSVHPLSKVAGSVRDHFHKR